MRETGKNEFDVHGEVIFKKYLKNVKLKQYEQQNCRNFATKSDFSEFLLEMITNVV